MPRCARSSARCGPTPLIMRTSVPRFIAIGERTEFIGRILFISFPQRRYGSCETCTVGVRTDRVRFRVLSGEVPLAGAPLGGLEECGPGFLGASGNVPLLSRHKYFFPAVPAASAAFSASP